MSILPEAILAAGVLAARPAFGSEGRLYYATDTEALFRDTGVAWEAYAGGGPHAILSATHSDADPQAVTRGSIIYGNITPEWGELVIGAANLFLRVNAGGTEPEWAAGGAGLYAAYYKAWDQKAQNTAGGGFTQGAWRTRDLNQEVDPDGIGALAANQITLDAGTYRCMIVCSAYNILRHQARLQNITGAATLLTGTSEINLAAGGAAGTTHSIISGRLTVAGGQVLEVQHQCQQTFAVSGFGLEANFTDEIYTIAEFWLEV